MEEFIHERHKPPSALARPRELIVAAPPLRSQVNLARIVRAAGCCGIRRIIACGAGKIDREIARDALDFVEVSRPRSLAPALEKLRGEGYPLIGLEQTTSSACLFDFAFPRKCVLVLGHERHGLDDDILRLLHAAVEIPVYGRPDSHNVATAAAMALYEYCRQYPLG